MRTVDSQIIMSIIKEIYNESPLETQCSLMDISKNLGVCYSTVRLCIKRLETLKILTYTGKGKSKRYTWLDLTFKPSEALAIRLGGTKVVAPKNRILEFSDSELIEELKSRGFLVYKEM